jgi:hypothetical protein
MLGTLPMVRAFSGTAYTAEFWISSASCPIDLGNNNGSSIQARFEWDITNGDAMTIKEVGQQNSTNAYGDFKFDEFTQGYYVISGPTDEYPGVEAWGDFQGYQFDEIGITVSAPADGTGNPTHIFPTMYHSESYNDNFSTTPEEFQIIISQSSSGITAEFDIISSGGTVLDNPTLTWSYPSGYTNPPPYANYGVSDELDGLELYGNANLLSGTDFQIESVIHPYTQTDFIGYYTQPYHQTSPGVGSQFTIPPTGGPCFSTWSEDEGVSNATYTYGSSGPVQSSNEYYQYVEVT